MKQIIICLFLSIFLVSCSSSKIVQNTSSWASVESETGATLKTAELEFSGTGNVQPDIAKSYYYLDSEKKSYDEKSFKDIISETPYTIVYFYPKDGTPNCTIQALDFSAMKQKFLNAWYQVIGVSKDDLASHKVFADKNELTIKLLQDKKGDLLKEFGAQGPLAEYGNGKELSDIIRSTFIIDKNGKAIYAFRDIEAIGHAQRIYDLISKK